MNFNDVALITEAARKTDLIEIPVVKYALLEAMYSSGNSHLDDIYKYYIQPKLIQQIAHPDPFFPNSKSIEGEIPIGFINQTNGLFKMDLNTNPVRNIAILGSTRKGKSILLRYFLVNKKGKFVAVDYKRGETRRILNVNKDILIFNNCFFNFLEIPLNVPYEVHRNSIIGDFCQAFGLLTGSESLALEVIDKTFKKYNFKPRLEDYYSELESTNLKNGPEYQFLGRIKNRVKLLLLTFNPTYYIREHYLEEMIDKYKGIIWELDGFPYESQTFASLRILSWLYNFTSYNKTQPITIAFDEIYRIFNSAVEDHSIQPSLTSYYINTIAARGLNIIGLSQQPSKVSNSFLANTSLKVCFHLGDGENINTVSKAMNLTKEQAQIIPFLKEGQAIVLTPECKKVELIQIPYFDVLDKPVSDDQVKFHMQRITGNENINKNISFKQLPPAIINNDNKPTISDLERQLLMTIHLNPFKYKTQHFKDMNLGGYKGEKIINSMKKYGFIKESEIHTGKRGKPIILLELTDKSYGILNLNHKNNPKDGSIEHKFWKNKIKIFEIEKGNKAVIEHNKYGKCVDVVSINNNEEVAIEVQLSEKYLFENVRDDMKYFNKIIIATHKDKIESFKKVLEGKFSNENMARINFRPLSEYFQ